MLQNLMLCVGAVFLLVALAGGGLSGCSTAHVGDTGDNTIVLSGDAKLGPFGNAVVELLKVDQTELGWSERKALIAPGDHRVVARCSLPLQHVLALQTLYFRARANHRYALKLRLLGREPGCAIDIVDQVSGEVVSKPNGSVNGSD